MGRDYTKYSVDNETFVGKGKLARLVIEQWINANGHRTLAQLQEIFKDEVQGSNFLRSKEDVENNYDRKRFDPTEVPCADKVVLVSNQWGSHNINALLKLCEEINVEVYNDSDAVDSETSSEASVQNEDVVEEDSVYGLVNSKLPEALACIIRHIIIADGSVIEDELNWMQVAFQEFGDANIDVYGAWDAVDSHTKFYSNIPGLYELALNSSVDYLSKHLPEDLRLRLIQILMQIAAQDDTIHPVEHQWILKVAEAFYPGHSKEIVTDVFKNANIL